MDDKVIRQARQAEEYAGKKDGRKGMTLDEFVSAYEIPPREVDFPWVMMIIFITIDIIDILFVFTGPGIVIWSAFTFLVVLPFEIWYVKQREEKYSDYKIQGTLDALHLKSAGDTAKNLAKKGAQIKRLESKVNELAKAGKAVRAAKLAGNIRRVVPPWLRYVMVICDKIPYIGIIPGNSLLLLFSYYDNKATVKAIQEGIKALAGNVDFKVTRIAGSNK